MPYLGRYQLGQTCPLWLRTDDASGTAVVPTRPPTCEVWSDSARVASKTLPACDRYAATGLFLLPLFLDGTYPAGRYRVTYNWNTGSYAGQSEDCFEVVAGGDAAGHVQSMFWIEYPHAKFLVHHLESGTVVFGRNPRV